MFPTSSNRKKATVSSCRKSCWKIICHCKDWTDILTYTVYCSVKKHHFFKAHVTLLRCCSESAINLHLSLIYNKSCCGRKMTSLFFIRARAAVFWTQLILTQFQWVVISSPLKAFGSGQRDDFKLEKVTGVLGNLLCLSRWKCVVTPKGDTYKFNRASVSPLKAASTIHKPGNTNSIFPGQHNCNRLKSVCLFLHSCGCMQVWMAVSLFLAFWFYMNLLMEFMGELIIICQ